MNTQVVKRRDSSSCGEILAGSNPASRKSAIVQWLGYLPFTLLLSSRNRVYLCFCEAETEEHAGDPGSIPGCGTASLAHLVEQRSNKAQATGSKPVRCIRCWVR